ncbi:MAG: glycoside hydrolase family 65 protein [Deltaproteobacteria bacterium]|jgi:trehalose/maltose hydrolase-like predicted phosphorylase|nr:glycoside hydrolase family 65 protein [Deltaproteobacteria bacterium]
MSKWALTYDSWKPEQQSLREALCVLGNGYFATRGAAEESSADEINYPGTYLAGGYNRLKTKISDRFIENEDLVNWPNWLCLSFRPEGGSWFSLSDVEILDYNQVLDVKKGILMRRMRFKDKKGRITLLECRRFVSASRRHLAGIRWELTPENWSGKIEIRSALDGTVSNQGVKRYRQLESQHLELLSVGSVTDDSIYLSVKTNQSHITMAQAARTKVYSGKKELKVQQRISRRAGMVTHTIKCKASKKKALRVEKMVVVFTTKDNAITEPELEAKNAIQNCVTFKEALKDHVRKWDHYWRYCDIGISGHPFAQFVLRLHIFHLVQTTSLKTIDMDAGVPARGLHGEAYRGHIFWDELFIFPFLNLRMPEVTRALLMYRYRRLPEARQAAEREGYHGAMFPWQSSSNGREETQVVHLNPKSNRWVSDNTHNQRHVNAAIAFNIWQYYQATKDIQFLSFYGAEMFLEIARFVASMTKYNPKRKRYEIHGVVGPDEFHTEYPDSKKLGLSNNAYTNVMFAWILWRAFDIMKAVGNARRDEILDNLQITKKELKLWDHISRRMFIPIQKDGIISQFEGFEKLKEFDWERYRRKYGDIQRLDRILEAEGDSPNRYKVSKQADLLMLFYLFSSEKLEEIFKRLGYKFDHESIPKNIEYYINRSSHGSTLSRIVVSWVLSRSDRKRSWELFQTALASDVADIQGGTTSEGIHLGAMSGTVDLVQRCYAGLEMRDGVLWFDPCLPDELKNLTFRLRYSGHWLKVRIEHSKLKISFNRSWSKPTKVGVKNKIYTMDEGMSREFKL